MNKPLVEKTAEKLIQLILDRGLDVGDRLPNEYDLANELNVSRNTLREVVRSLATRNVVEVRQGSGTYISSKRGISEDPLGFSLVTDSEQLLVDLFELRTLVEPRVAERVVQYASDEEIQRLIKVANQIEISIKNDDGQHTELDVEFHSLLAKMSKNIAMKHLIPVLNQSIYLINKEYTNEKMKNSSIHEHREIIEAIEKRDAILAYDAMLRHVLSVYREAKL